MPQAQLEKVLSAWLLRLFTHSSILVHSPLLHPCWCLKNFLSISNGLSYGIGIWLFFLRVSALVSLPRPGWAFHCLAVFTYKWFLVFWFLSGFLTVKVFLIEINNFHFGKFILEPAESTKVRQGSSEQHRFILMYIKQQVLYFIRSHI